MKTVFLSVLYRAWSALGAAEIQFAGSLIVYSDWIMLKYQSKPKETSAFKPNQHIATRIVTSEITMCRGLSTEICKRQALY